MGIGSWFSNSLLGKVLNMPFSWISSHSAKPAEYVSAYFTGVKIVSENMAKMTQLILDENNKEFKHNLTPLFKHRPNNYQNKNKFWQQVESRRIDYGNAYVYIQRESKTARPIAFHIIDNHSITDINIKSNGKMYYKYDAAHSPMMPKLNKTEIAADDVMHFTFGNKVGMGGTRALDVASAYTDILSKATAMIDSFYANNATSTLAIETNIDRASVATRMGEAVDKFIDESSGVYNSGKLVKLPPNTKLVPIHQKFVDAQVLETQRHAREEIANLLGIPQFMFQSVDSNESIEQQTLSFLAFTITPIIEHYIAEFEFKLLTQSEIDNGVHFEYDTEKLISTDLKTKAEVVALQVSKGLLSPNAGARKMGNDIIDSPYGDLSYVQSQNQAIQYYDKWGSGGSISENTKDKKEEDEDE